MTPSARIEILDSGLIDRNDSAFATLVVLDGDNILCGYSVGGGAHALGGTHCSRSTDGGLTWNHQGAVLAAADEGRVTNHLRLSRTPAGTILAYGQRDFRETAGGPYDDSRDEAIVCRSNDEGRSWSDPQVLPPHIPGPYEISNPIVTLDDGRWLAPAATYHNGRYGERVVVFESEDEGATWPRTHTVFEHPAKQVGYLEQKLIRCQPDRLMAVAWRQDFQRDADLDNAICFSNDGGRTWSEPHATGVQGQTMTPVWLGDDRYCVLYNYRFGQQTIRMCLVRASEQSWQTEFEDVLWDPQTNLSWTDDMSSNEQIKRITFGYPMAVRLDEQTILATHWCVEDDICGIRWTRLQVHN